MVYLEIAGPVTNFDNWNSWIEGIPHLGTNLYKVGALFFFVDAHNLINHVFFWDVTVVNGFIHVYI